MSSFRRLLIALVLVFNVFSVSYAQKTAQKPEKKASIALDSMKTNLGVFPKSASTKTVVFTFKNVGNDKLVFYGGSGDCGCIKVSYPEKPIKPGRKGQIVVTYRGLNKNPGRFNHKVNFSVSGSPSHFTLRVAGEMTKN